MNQFECQLVECYGKNYVVQDEGGRSFFAVSRSKKVDYACGDWVSVTALNNEQVVIEKLIKRKTFIYRQDAYKKKLIAANVSQLLFIIAVEPSFNEFLLQRVLLAAQFSGVHPVIVINKKDLGGTDQVKNQLSYYVELGYDFLELSAFQDIQSLRDIMEGETNLLMGQSGMGKSSLINALLGEQVAKVNDISFVLNSGKHTTTHSKMYQFNQITSIIDTPGLQKFGVDFITKEELLDCFSEMKIYKGQCNFHNCTHQKEPHCAIKNAMERGEIHPKRLKLYQDIYEEISRKSLY